MANHESFNIEGAGEQKEQRIEALLPRYYEAYGENPKYEIERSMMMDGHEVAWVKYSGEVTYDITGQGKEGNLYSGHELYCACKFTEGVGWRVEEDGRPVGLMGGDGCLKKEAALHLRHLELREEYKSRKMLGNFHSSPEEEIEPIMFDLMEKAKAEELIEATSGARFWGGYYYLQTISSITDLPMRTIWEIADKMVHDKKIQLEGAVVQEYFEPAPANWEEYMSVEKDGVKVVASLPTHSKMDQAWQFEAYKISGGTEEKIELEIPQEPLTYTPTFGPDAGDVAHAEELMTKILESVLRDK